MDYAKKNKINVGGFDVQRTGNIFGNFVTSNQPSSNMNQLESSFLILKKKLSSYKTNYSTISEDVNLLIDQFNIIKEKQTDVYIFRTLENRIEYLKYMSEFCKAKNYHERWKARDSAMAKNVDWILSQYPPDQKVILIGHNFHIAKFNKNESVMGEFLNKAFGNSMYVLGVFAESGSYSDNSGRERLLTEPHNEEIDIKHIMNKITAPLSYINFSKKNLEQLPFFSDPIVVNDTFIDLKNTNKLNLGKSFDGVLLYKHVSPSKH